MPGFPDELLRIDEQVEARKLAESTARSVALFERDDVRVALFAPRGVDTQSPHDRDEIYVVSSGSGKLHCDGRIVEFKAGDLLFVPARAEHRFEDFSADFRTWVLFFGPSRS